MKVHVQRICQTSFYQLRSMRRSLSVNACTALVHAFVTSKLDYCKQPAGWNRRWFNRSTADCDASDGPLWSAWSTGGASTIQSRPTFVIVYTGSPSVQESTSSWVFSFTSASMISFLHISRRCLYLNQLFRPSPVFEFTCFSNKD